MGNPGISFRNPLRIQGTVPSESLRIALINKGIKSSLAESVDLPVTVPHSVTLSFEQQKDLVLLQMEQRKMEFKMEIEKRKLEQETVFVQQVLEKRKLYLQQQRLDPMKEGKVRMLSDGDLHEVVESGPLSSNFNVAANLRLMPLFNEEDVDTFSCYLNVLRTNKYGLALNVP